MKSKIILLEIFALAVAVCGLLTLSACGDDPTPLAAPEIVLQGNIISWTAVENADGYEIYEDNVKIAETAETSYTIEKTASGAYSYTVKATSKNSSYSASAFSNAAVYEFSAESGKLSAPILTLSENVLNWEPVDNANIYIIYENGEEIARQLTTSFTIIAAEEGEYRYTVKATSYNANYADSDSSNEVVFEVTASYSEPVQLTAPDLSINGKILTWTAVDHATSYAVYENGYLVVSTKSLSYEINQSQLGVYRYVVIATSTNSAYLTSPESNTVEYTVSPAALQAPVVTIVNGILTWDPVEGAEAYIVYENYLPVARITNPGYRCEPSSYGNIIYTVVAYPADGDERYFVSEASEPVIFNFSDDRPQLPAPSLSLQTRTNAMGEEYKVIAWSQVAQANGYEVYENGRRVFVTEGLEYALTRVQPATYSYTVKAVSDYLYKASEFSQPLEYVIDTENINFSLSVTLPEDFSQQMITVALYRTINGLPQSAVKQVTVPSANAANVILSAPNNAEYILKITSQLPNDCAASEAKVSAAATSAEITVYKKTEYRSIVVGNNSFTVINSRQDDAPNGIGTTQTGYLFVAPEAAQYYIQSTSDLSMNIWFNDKCVIENSQWLTQYAFTADANEAIEVSFAGHEAGSHTFRIVKGELKQSLRIAKGWGDGPNNVVVDGDNSAVFYLTLEETTTLTFMFGTGNLGLRYVTVTIDGVDYDFDGLNNTKNITIEAGRDIEIKVAVLVTDPSSLLQMNIGFFVFPIL